MKLSRLHLAGLVLSAVCLASGLLALGASPAYAWQVTCPRYGVVHLQRETMDGTSTATVTIYSTAVISEAAFGDGTFDNNMIGGPLWFLLNTVSVGSSVQGFDYLAAGASKWVLVKLSDTQSFVLANQADRVYVQDFGDESLYSRLYSPLTVRLAAAASLPVTMATAVPVVPGGGAASFPVTFTASPVSGTSSIATSVIASIPVAPAESANAVELQAALFIGMLLLVIFSGASLVVQVTR